jgi:hypothetical protein
MESLNIKIKKPLFLKFKRYLNSQVLVSIHYATLKQQIKQEISLFVEFQESPSLTTAPLALYSLVQAATNEIISVIKHLFFNQTSLPSCT